MTCTVWKSSACINPMNPYNNLMKWILLLTLFSKWGNWGMESILAISYGCCNKVPQTCWLKTKGNDLSQNNSGGQKSKTSTIGWKSRCQLSHSSEGSAGESILCHFQLWWLPEFLGFWPNHPNVPSLHNHIVFSSSVYVQSPSAPLLQGYMRLHLGPT